MEQLGQSKTNKILICGIGNLLMSDDGFAHYVIKILEDKIGFKDNFKDIDIVEFGTVNFTMANYLEGYKCVIFIDAIHQNKSPGEIYEFWIKGKEIKDSFDPFKFSFSFHDSDLHDMLAFAKKMKFLPEDIIIIGCEPKIIKKGIGLSKEVSEASERVAKRISEILEILI